jgi:chromosomal replication initiation ATPase DnaA
METVAPRRKRKSCPRRGQTFGPKMDDIINDISEVYGLSIEAIKGKIRTWDLVLCRRLFIYICKTKTDAPLRDIGIFLNRDHTNCCYHLSNLRSWIKNKDAVFIDEWDNYVVRSKLWSKI